MHRDLKTSSLLLILTNRFPLGNILLSSKRDLGKIKIIDMGLATKTDQFNYKRCGTMLYMAPELINN